MYIRVKVQPDAKKELFEQISDTVFHIAVREKAERNMANDRIRQLVALHFKVPVGKVRIISGHHQPVKMLAVEVEEHS